MSCSIDAKFKSIVFNESPDFQFASKHVLLLENVSMRLFDLCEETNVCFRTLVKLSLSSTSPLVAVACLLSRQRSSGGGVATDVFARRQYA